MLCVMPVREFERRLGADRDGSLSLWPGAWPRNWFVLAGVRGAVRLARFDHGSPHLVARLVVLP